MGWAHEGAATSSIATIATWTRVAGLGGGGLGSMATYWVDEVPGPSSKVFRLTVAVPGPGSEVPEPALTAVFLEPSAGALESDPTSSGGAGTKMESDSGEGLTNGLRRL